MNEVTIKFDDKSYKLVKRLAAACDCSVERIIEVCVLEIFSTMVANHRNQNKK